MTTDFHPWRRKLAVVPSQVVPIQPLIPSLSFIADKQRWGFPFRRGLFAVDPTDFAQIAAAMGVTIDLS